MRFIKINLIKRFINHLISYPSLRTISSLKFRSFAGLIFIRAPIYINTLEVSNSWFFLIPIITVGIGYGFKKFCDWLWSDVSIIPTIKKIIVESDPILDIIKPPIPLVLNIDYIPDAPPRGDTIYIPAIENIHQQQHDELLSNIYALQNELNWLNFKYERALGFSDSVFIQNTRVTRYGIKHNNLEVMINRYEHLYNREIPVQAFKTLMASSPLDLYRPFYIYIFCFFFILGFIYKGFYIFKCLKKL